MFGTPISKSSVTGKAKQYPSWYTSQKISSVFTPIYDKGFWGFDCIGLIKGVLWGWNGDASKTYGGATYASNGVPDISADAMINQCKNISTDFNRIELGEFVWMKGHCGVYIGSGQVVESSPKWKNGVQITSLRDREWLKHGKLPYIEYDVTAVVVEVKRTNIELTVLQIGNKGNEVKTLQRLLKSLGYKGSDSKALSVDGDFGKNTQYALKSFQKDKGLLVDGICGKNSWNTLLK